MSNLYIAPSHCTVNQDIWAFDLFHKRKKTTKSTNWLGCLHLITIIIMFSPSQVMTHHVFKLASQTFCQACLSGCLLVLMSSSLSASYVFLRSPARTLWSFLYILLLCYLDPLHTTVLLRLSFARITHSTCFQALLTHSKHRLSCSPHHRHFTL